MNERSESVSRRRVLAGGLGALAMAGAAGCGDRRSGGTDRSRSAAASGASVSVRHKYGVTVVPPAPRRVVTLGYTDQEPLLALGVRPVGVVDFFGERPYGSWPWEKDRWKGQRPQLVGNRDDYDFEKIAALDPDLIVGLYSGLTKDNYDKLRRIAPTVAQPPGYADFAAPWSLTTVMAGAAVGQRHRAQQLVADTHARFAAARRAHPQWNGRAVAVVEPAQAGQWAVFGAADPKLQFMQSLGFAIAPAVRRIEAGGDVAQLSTERLTLLDVDQLILLIGTGDQTEAQVRANPLFTKLTAAREGRTLFLPFGTTPPVGAALAFNSVLSIPYGIQRVVAGLDAGDGGSSGH